MTLGYLDGILLRSLLPLNYLNWDLRKESDKIHVFWSPSGCGKTTLCDAIEYSLFLDLYYKPKEALREKFKISSKDGIKRGIIKSRWVFGDKSLVIDQEIKGKRTNYYLHAKRKQIKADDYEKNIIFQNLGISQSKAMHLYNALTFIREDRNYPFFEKRETEEIFKVIKDLLYDPSVHAKKLKTETRLGELNSKYNEKRRKAQELWASLHDTRAEPEIKEALSQNTKLLEQIEKKIIDIKEKISELDYKLENCINKPMSPRFKEVIEELAIKKSDLDIIKERDEVIRRQLQELSKGLLPDLDERKKVFLNEPICPTCLQNRIQVWDSRLNEYCPECGLRWDVSEIKEKKDAYEATRSVLTKQQNEIGAKITRLRQEIKSLDNEKKTLENEFRLNKKSCQGIRDSIRDNQNKLDEYNGEKSRISGLIEHLTQAMDTRTKEDYDELSKEIVEIRNNIQSQEMQITDLEKQIMERFDDFIKDVEAKFVNIAKENLNFGNIDLNLRKGEIIIDDVSALFFNLSGSERDICDLITRICVWQSLIKYKKATKGFLVIDSLETYDVSRKKDMIKILKSLPQDKFNIILATNSQDTANKLSDFPKRFECERQGLWFFFRKSQWLTEKEEENLKSDIDID